MILLNIINLLNQRYAFMKHDKFANKNWKGVIPGEKRKTCFADKDLSS